MWYQNIRSALFNFVTIHASDGQTDRRTDGQNSDSNTVRCITCSRTVKIVSESLRLLIETKTERARDAQAYPKEEDDCIR